MAEGSGQNVKNQRRTPTIGIKLAAADFVRFNEYCRFEGKNRSEMARKAILFYMEAQQRGSEEAKESLLEKRLRKMEDRLAKMISRTMIDIGIVNQVFYKRASKEERDKLWDAAKTAALERLRFKRKDGDQEATGVIRDVPHSSEG